LPHTITAKDALKDQSASMSINTRPRYMRMLQGPAFLSLICALALAGGLFFIDEDNYSFRHITEPANLCSLLLYAFAFWMGQLIAYRFLFSRYSAPTRFLLALVFGVLIGLAILVFLLFVFVFLLKK